MMPHNKQQGAALVMGLLFLAILTLLGLITMGSGQLSEGMSRNSRDYLLALQVAERALHACESEVTRGFTCTLPGTYASAPGTLVSADVDWKSAEQTRNPAGFEDLPDPPRCVIECLGYQPDLTSSWRSGEPATGYDHYRITARAGGMYPSTIVQLESTLRFARNE